MPTPRRHVDTVRDVLDEMRANNRAYVKSNHIERECHIDTKRIGEALSVLADEGELEAWSETRADATTWRIIYD